MSKKIVIAFEGIEGSGKTFHIDNVSKYLKRKKIPYIKLREPGGNKNSEKIRKLILDKKSNFNKNTDLLLYLAARSENMDNLKKNFRKKIILLDRFTDSTIAYQHFGMGVNLDIIKKGKKKLLKVKMLYEGPVEAPISKYQVLAKLRIIYDDELIDEYDLLAKEQVNKVNIFSRLMKSLNYLIWGDV